MGVSRLSGGGRPPVEVDGAIVLDVSLETKGFSVGAELKFVVSYRSTGIVGNQVRIVKPDVAHPPADKLAGFMDATQLVQRLWVQVKLLHQRLPNLV